MRLWHQKLIPYLPRQQLLGQHRECCALRGKGWGRKHSVVNYVFTYNPEYLVTYHWLVMDEMIHRGYHPDPTWRNPNWRGSALREQQNWCNTSKVEILYTEIIDLGLNIYPEHNNAYLQECKENLHNKGIDIQI